MKSLLFLIIFIAGYTFGYWNFYVHHYEKPLPKKDLSKTLIIEHDTESKTFRVFDGTKWIDTNNGELYFNAKIKCTFEPTESISLLIDSCDLTINYPNP